jgi:predicted DCC family thiol-disulfide oxidoreductase YuxK
LQKGRPILLYDNDCGICSTFARLAAQTSKGWIETVGLFTEHGRKVKSSFFGPGDNPDEMFWILAGNTGYGGRCGFLPLVREIVRGRIL